MIEELEETISQFDDFIMKANYDLTKYADKDLILLDKIYDYLLELKERYK